MRKHEVAEKCNPFKVFCPRERKRKKECSEV